MASGPSFTVGGLSPRFDPLWTLASKEVKALYFRYAAAVVLRIKDSELERGLNAKGGALKGISPETAARRFSEMGPADPMAPPLMPAYGLSRTRSLLQAEAAKDGVKVSWAFDIVTGMNWGDILTHQKAQGRDVFGLSPAGTQTARTELLAWWAARRFLLTTGGKSALRSIEAEVSTAEDNAVGVIPQPGTRLTGRRVAARFDAESRRTIGQTSSKQWSDQTRFTTFASGLSTISRKGQLTTSDGRIRQGRSMRLSSLR